MAWWGPSYTLAEWSAPDRRVLDATMRDAYNGLAAMILSTAEPLWRNAR